MHTEAETRFSPPEEHVGYSYSYRQCRLIGQRLFVYERDPSAETHTSASQSPGGFTGSYFFPQVEEGLGLHVVLVSCSVIAFAGAVLTVVTLDDGDAKTRSPSRPPGEEMSQLPLAQDDELGVPRHVAGSTLYSP
jgi:hypothetical protein